MVAKKKAAVKKKTVAKKPVKNAITEIKKGIAKAEITQIDRIEKMMKRTLNVVEFLEAEIIKARDAHDETKKIEATPYDENT